MTEWTKEKLEQEWERANRESADAATARGSSWTRGQGGAASRFINAILAAQEDAPDWKSLFYRACGYISTTPEWSDKHPEEVVEYFTNKRNEDDQIEGREHDA